MSQDSNATWMSGGAHREIVTIGDPRLRETAHPVDEVGDAHELCDRMVALLRELAGAGLAAPQIGANKRVIVVEVRKTTLFPDRPESPLLVMVNPEIVWRSDSIENGWEGCFSVPGLMGMVSRHNEIKMRYLDINGEKREELFSGYVARVIQHEYDHLDGKDFLDRMTSMESITTVANYVQFHHRK